MKLKGLGRTDPERICTIPPSRQLGHNSHTPQPRENEINNGIALFAEASELCFLADTGILSEGTAEVYSDNLAEEREEDNVIRDEDEVEVSFSIVWLIWVASWGWSGMGYE